jgi:transglutaminase-like putative cysteine protease
VQCCGFYPGPVPSVLLCIPEGEAGTRATLAVMRQLVRTYSRDAGVRTLALRLTRGIPQYDPVGEVAALHGFARDAITYREDIEDTETVQTPVYTLQEGAGDCDDKVTLLCTLLTCLGYKTCFFAVGFGGPYEHVLAGVRMGTRWLPMETVIPECSCGPGSATLGWMPPGVSPVLRYRV